jgi:aspartate/methionine/tyrosine aminotransferase
MASSVLSQRVGAIAPSATLAVTSKAKALKAAGEPVIGFGAGEPDFPTPDHIVEAAVAACRQPENHRYSPSPGLPALREALAAKTMRDSGYEVAPEQIVVTNGGKQAVFNTCLTLFGEGDEVLLPAPYWTTYPEPIRLAGATPVVLPTDRESQFKVTVAQLEAARTANTKAMLFCSPSNPTGTVYSREEIEAIGHWAVEHGIWVITDEIYEHLTYPPYEHHSMPTLVPDLASHCVVLNGVAKTYAMTGWRVGWLIAPLEVAKAATNLQSHQTSNVNNVAQQAALAAVSGPLDAVHTMREAFLRRGKTIHAMLQDIDGVECLEPQGAFYAFPSFEGVLGRSIAGKTPSTTAELADVFLDEAKVAMVPGEAFEAPGYMRLSFALSDADIEEGIGRIAKLLA